MLFVMYCIVSGKNDFFVMILPLSLSFFFRTQLCCRCVNGVNGFRCVADIVCAICAISAADVA